MQGGPHGRGQVVAERVASGEVHGAAWLVDRGGTCRAARRGVARPDSIFRISSVTKPVVAALAMTLVDDGAARASTTPSTRCCPSSRTAASCAARTARSTTPSPPTRPITVRDVLEFRLGLGMDFAGPFPGAVLGALAERGLPVGPPAPQHAPPPDEWMRIVGAVPLSVQPGARWLYNTGAQVLGVLVARAAGRAAARAARGAGARPARHAGHRRSTCRADRLDRLGRQWLGPRSLRRARRPVVASRRRSRTPPRAWSRRSRTCTRSRDALPRRHLLRPQRVTRW